MTFRELVQTRGIETIELTFIESKIGIPDQIKRKTFHKKAGFPNWFKRLSFHQSAFNPDTFQAITPCFEICHKDIIVNVFGKVLVINIYI